ncbi:nuclear transport factor 2 family protein [Muricauda sp. CAU 1633]|nr:nuclear transport factor 2 family protein [Muricauda sp. CAU 1633]
MKYRKSWGLLIVFLLVGMNTSLAQNTFDAHAYIKAYFSLDQEGFSSFLDDKVVWSDPTWSEVAPGNKPVEGKQNMLEHLKVATAGLSNMHYKIDYQFQSGNMYVFEGTLNYSWTDPNGKQFDFSIREVSVLKTKEGKIIEHTDYGDFKTWREQYLNQSENN